MWVALITGQAQQAQSHQLQERVLQLLPSPFPTSCPPPPRLGLKEPLVNGEVVSLSQPHPLWESQLQTLSLRREERDEALLPS